VVCHYRPPCQVVIDLLVNVPESHWSTCYDPSPLTALRVPFCHLIGAVTMNFFIKYFSKMVAHLLGNQIEEQKKLWKSTN
jgi:hypothetical protein